MRVGGFCAKALVAETTAAKAAAAITRRVIFTLRIVYPSDPRGLDAACQTREPLTAPLIPAAQSGTNVAIS
jgi:hypothetical protein